MLISRPKSRQFGFSLIELLVVVTILGILMSVAAPNFRTWMINSQIRNAAESISNGLQRARAEAVSRNTNVTFTLTSPLNPQDSSWSVTAAASGIDSRSSMEGSKTVTVTGLAADLVTAATAITYNSFGGVVINPNSLARINFNSLGATKSLRVVIGLGGSPRMCDPSMPATSTSGCP